MERFNGEIFYTVIESVHKKELLKIKSVSNDIESNYPCMDCEIVDSCISIKLAESCFTANRHFIKMKIYNELKKNNLTF